MKKLLSMINDFRYPAHLLDFAFQLAKKGSLKISKKVLFRHFFQAQARHSLLHIHSYFK